MLLHQCYVNKYNLFNQVGVVALNVLGEAPPRAAGYSGSRGRADAPQPAMSPRGVAVDMKLDPVTAARVKEVRREKRAAVEAEDTRPRSGSRRPRRGC